MSGTSDFQKSGFNLVPKVCCILKKEPFGTGSTNSYTFFAFLFFSDELCKLSLYESKISKILFFPRGAREKLGFVKFPKNVRKSAKCVNCC